MMKNKRIHTSLLSEYLWGSEILTFGQLLKKILIFSILLFVSSPAYAINIDEMLANLQADLGPLTELVTAFAYLAGFLMVFRALYQLKQYGEARLMSSSNTDLKGPLVGLIIGASLIYFPSILRAALVTVYGTSTLTEYEMGSTGWDNMGSTLVSIVQFVGGVAFIRGLMQLHKIGQGQAQQNAFGKAVLHIMGGIMALNIVEVTNIFFSTLGIQ